MLALQLTKVFLTYFPLGWLLYLVSAPWWVVLIVLIIVVSSTRLENKPDGSGFEVGCCFAILFTFLLPIIGFVAIAIGMQATVWLSNEESLTFYGTTFATVFGLMLTFAVLQKYFPRYGNYFWVVLLVSTWILATKFYQVFQSLTWEKPYFNWVGLGFIPAFTQLLDLIDTGIAFAIVWALSVFNSIFPAKQLLHQSLSRSQTSRLLIAFVVTSLGLGWVMALGLQGYR